MAEGMKQLVEQMKSQLSCIDVAERLNLRRAKGASSGRGVFFHAPGHDDKNPSLSIFDDGRAFKDWSADGTPGAAGSVIDLVMWVRGCDFMAAVDWLCQAYDYTKPAAGEAAAPRTLEESVAQRCQRQATQAIAYLCDQRHLPTALIEQAIKDGAVGYDDYRNPKIGEGERMHGGPAAAFIVRTMNPGAVKAVDLRYIDPETNGGLKTKTIGDKQGLPWYQNLRALKKARVVYVVESPINALSVHAADMKGVAAVATRGLGVEEIDWRFLMGKEVRICMDADRTNDRGNRPGPESAWRLLDVLNAQNTAAFLVDQSHWYGHAPGDDTNDVNDMLAAVGADRLRGHLQRIDHSIIPGFAANQPDHMRGEKQRLFLPTYDYSVYWKYHAQPDYTSFVKSVEEGEEGASIPDYAPCCGFRVADISRVQIQSANATMTGGDDAQPDVQFAVAVQVPQHGHQLVRRVFQDEHLHNLQHWAKFGPIFAPQAMARMLSILVRLSMTNSRTAANFVGLCWLDGKLRANEGADTYFVEPTKQCPYHNLTFPRGPKQNAGIVMRAYQDTFRDNAASMVLVWMLGAHLKAILGFWPHMQMQARKASGKSTLVRRLSLTTAFRMMSGQMTQTEYRMITSISHTSHPVGWSEISARNQDVINRAVALLQESYGYELHTRGSENLAYLNSAPVLLEGEDVPVESLTGKLVRTDLSGKKGPMLPADLPKFPVWGWLQWLAEADVGAVRERFEALRVAARESSRASGNDDGAARMAENYAALMLAWELLTEFAGMDRDEGGFRGDLIAVMNRHIGETSHDRDPWMWILEILLSELSAHRYVHPHVWDWVEGDDGRQYQVLILRTSHVMDHIRTSNHLRSRFDSLPVKSDRVFKSQLREASMFVEEGIERTVKGARMSHAVALGVERMEAYGLSVPVPDTATADIPY